MSAYIIMTWILSWRSSVTMLCLLSWYSLLISYSWIFLLNNRQNLVVKSRASYVALGKNHFIEPREIRFIMECHLQARSVFLERKLAQNTSSSSDFLGRAPNLPPLKNPSNENKQKTLQQNPLQAKFPNIDTLHKLCKWDGVT